MTVNELIQQLQNIPDSLKDCSIEMCQYDDCYNNTCDIYNIHAKAVVGCGYEDMTFEEAEKLDSYKYIVLA